MNCKGSMTFFSVYYSFYNSISCILCAKFVKDVFWLYSILLCMLEFKFDSLPSRLLYQCLWLFFSVIVCNTLSFCFYVSFTFITLIFFYSGLFTLHSHNSFYELPLYSLQIFRLNDRHCNSCYFFFFLYWHACFWMLFYRTLR